MAKIMAPTDITGTSEHSIQSALFAWIAVARMAGFERAWRFDRTGILPTPVEKPVIPELAWIFAVPNGGKLGDGRIQARRGAKMKAEGMKAGVSDIMWPIARGGYHGLFIEMKTPKGRVSQEQSEFLAFARAQGYKATVCRSWESAAKVVESYYNS